MSTIITSENKLPPIVKDTIHGGCFLTVATPLSLILVSSWIVELVQRRRCPDGTFAVLANDHGLSAISVIFLSGLGPFFALFLLGLFPRISTEWNRWSPSLSFRGVRAFFGIIAALSAVASLLILSICSVEEICLTPQNIEIQSSITSGLRHYAWSDVVVLSVSCFKITDRHGDYWFASPALKLNDGRVVNLNSLISKRGISGYVPIARALHGQHYKLDASEVDPHCSAPGIGFLLKRP